MKKKLAIIALFCTGLIWTQPLEKSLLWKITGNGITAPSYLFGTIHMSCDATLDKNVQAAMDVTQQLYLEIDLDDISLQTALMQQMIMKDGQKMSDLVSKEDFAAVDAFIQEKLGMPLEMFNTIKPVFISMMLMPQLMDCEVQSVEQELVKLSTAQNEQVYGLETIDDQITALDAVPYQEQMDELVQAAKSTNLDDRKELEALFATYKSKDIEAMLQQSRESGNPMTAKYETQLLTSRNRSWIPKISAVSKEKPSFFAVGAAHLAGEEGVIKLLRRAGFSVEAVL